MTAKTNNDLVLGPDVIQWLLPHDRPFLMVDRITSYRWTPKLVLEAERHISANEPVFAGHFPGLRIWPGVYTIEGLGQSCNLLVVLHGMQQHWEEHGSCGDEMLRVLQNLELGYRLQPGFRADLVTCLEEGLADGSSRVGFSAAVDIKFLEPVFAGQCLTYIVCQTHAIDDIIRFEVEAQISGRPVARGRMTVRNGVQVPRLQLIRR